MTDKRAGHAPALFDDVLIAEDIERASNTGREVALASRAEYERNGVPLNDLLPCEEEGPDGTVLAHCMKIYLPRPVGKFGMVFRIALREGKAQLVYAAFGVRHHPRDSHAPTVYEIAHNRLQS
ncbi:MAG TPA: hypothetical protein VHQ43_11260 [Solirubrobacterales bacterium]|jgi:hypothetical protein|nr:hypothetical protein [Solirubrobacterales bacterium]